jgi:hypothetical protein
MRVWKLPAEVSWITGLSQVLHRRHAWRRLPLLVGLLFAQGRRTVTRRLRAVGIGRGFQRSYYFLGSLGRKTGPTRHRFSKIPSPRRISSRKLGSRAAAKRFLAMLSLDG